VVGARRVGDSGGIDWIGISNRILIEIRRLNFGYAPMLLESNDLGMQMIVKKFNRISSFLPMFLN
jgi:hypothetical protein